MKKKMFWGTVTITVVIIICAVGVKLYSQDMSRLKANEKVEGLNLELVEIEAPVQYENIESVSLRLGYPPFTGYTLTTAEINDFIGCLEKIDFAEYEPETVLPDGDGVECFITTMDEKLYRINFLKPYIGVDGDLYEIGMDQEIFGVVDNIIKN